MGVSLLHACSSPAGSWSMMAENAGKRRANGMQVLVDLTSSGHQDRSGASASP